MSSQLMEALRSQVEELQALEAMYPEEGALCFTAAERAATDLATSLVETSAGESGDAAQQQQSHLRSQLGSLSQLSGALVFQSLAVGGQPVSLRFTLPPQYPLAAAPRLQVECACGRAHHDELTAVVQPVSDYVPEGGCLITAADALQQRVSELLEQGVIQAAEAAQGVTDKRESQRPSHRTMRCCIIWFHHIKSLTKRKHIVQWADELRLGGFSKPGFPGVIVVEGLADDMEEYVQRLRALKWQAMAVRGQEDMEASNDVAALGAARRFGSDSNLQELPETGMSELAAACRAAGLEDLFLAALKIVK